MSKQRKIRKLVKKLEATQGEPMWRCPIFLDAIRQMMVHTAIKKAISEDKEIQTAYDKARLSPEEFQKRLEKGLRGVMYGNKETTD